MLYLEHWKSIPNYEGFYEVSNVGNVRSLDRYVTQKRNGNAYKIRQKSKPLKPHNNSGYYTVSLLKNGKQQTVGVHRLVARAFIGKQKTGMLTCHNNGRSLDSRLSNLRYDTPKSNAHDRFKHGTCKAPLSEIQIDRLLRSRAAGAKTVELAVEFDVSMGSVLKIIRASIGA